MNFTRYPQLDNLSQFCIEVDTPLGKTLLYLDNNLKEQIDQLEDITSLDLTINGGKFDGLKVRFLE